MNKKGFNFNKLIGFNVFTITLVLVVFLAGVGLTYAYYAFSYEEESVIVGNVINVDIDLDVELVVGTNDDMVPMLDGALSNAINGVGSPNGACIDKYGNLSCQVYKITLINKGSRVKHLDGTIELYPKEGTDNAYSNLKWRELSNTTTVKSDAVVNGMNESVLVSDLTMESKETKVWYIAVWISEIDSDQRETDKGLFGGTVKFETGSESINNNLSAAEYIMNSNSAGLNTNLEAGMYRYQGTTVDNYICFGTNDKNECLNNTDAYLYRVIGINSENQVKLIKKEALNSAIRWFYGNTDISWPNSTLYSEINGSSFLTNETYVPSSWSNKIATVSWKYGDLSDSAAASSIYSTENGWANTTSAKVGLMYVHDYFYASQSGGLNCNSSSSQCKASWIHLTNNDVNSPNAMEWTMTRHGYNSYYAVWTAWQIYGEGTINWGGSEYSNSRTARPVFYLKETESIVSGKGTSDDPFIIFKEELSISADKAATYIMNSNSTGLNTSLEAGMYRYQGTLANNYICFGTRDKNDCLSNTDAHLYRIIGINSDNQLKLIKKEALNSTIKWFSSNSDISWPNSTLYSEINGNSFLSNDTYVPSGWSDKIATVSWKYGDLSDSAAASSIYSIENGWTNTTSAKVGLMYAHDYFYASQSGGLNCNTYSSRCKASWIHLTNNDSGRPDAMEWTMTRHGYNSYYSTWIAWLIYDDGTINWGNSEYPSSKTVRPVFYLNEDVFIVSGNGTQTNPFIISS